jgi:hypothetical protein
MPATAAIHFESEIHQTPIDRAAVNRANSKHSTGPRTEAGKQRSSQRSPPRPDCPHRRPRLRKSSGLREPPPPIRRPIQARQSNRNPTSPGTGRDVLASPPHPAPRSGPLPPSPQPRVPNPAARLPRPPRLPPLTPVPKDARPASRHPIRAPPARTPRAQGRRRHPRTP